jgi:hypothetical protein
MYTIPGYDQWKLAAPEDNWRTCPKCGASEEDAIDTEDGPVCYQCANDDWDYDGWTDADECQYDRRMTWDYEGRMS